MPEPTDTAAEEFVTIAEAARLLGVDARQIRRYLARLAPTDRATDTQRTHKGQPIVLVRLSAVQALRGADSDREEPKDTGNGHQRTRQRTGQDTSFDAVGALIAEKDARISELTAALEHERESHRNAETLHLGTMAELQELRRRASELEAMNAKLIEALPIPQEAAQETPSDAQDDPTEAHDVEAMERERAEALEVAGRLAAEVQELRARLSVQDGPNEATERPYSYFSTERVHPEPEAENLSKPDISAKAEGQDTPRRWWQVWRKGAG